MKNNKEEFITKAKQVHFNENLDYSQVVYVNNRTPVKIIDHDLDENGVEYGEFWQSPYNHLRGQCHPKKRGKRISLAKRNEENNVIARFKEVHKGENLDYSQVKYVNMHTKVKIICHDLRSDGTEYGEFWQEPAVHLKGCTHPELARNKQIVWNKYDTDIFIEKAKEIHKKDDYSYDLVDYKGSRQKVCIICNKTNKKGQKHGEFYVNPDSFLQGKGCPKCGNHLSTGEDEIYEFLVDKLGKKEVIRHDTSLLEGKELDILLPNHNLAIEFNGLRWHSEEFNKDCHYHLSKTLACEKKGYQLIHIFEDEFLYHKDIVLNKIGHILKLNQNLPKIYARNCKIKHIEDRYLVSDFLNKNHIQGTCGYTKSIGCFCNNELIGIMTFIKEKDVWNLNRYCTNINYLCIGVASKIFSYFLKEENPEEVKSFLDRRWGKSGNNLYAKIGFREDSVLKPNYSYTNGHSERKHKFGFRKEKLHKKYGFPLTMTEYEMTQELGYYRIWDCGLIKYVWKKKEG